MPWDLLKEKPKLANQNTVAANGRADILVMGCLQSPSFLLFLSFTPPPSRFFVLAPLFARSLDRPRYSISKVALNFFLEILIKIRKFLQNLLKFPRTEHHFLKMFFSTFFAFCQEKMAK